MDDVVLASNYPEITGNAVFLDEAIYARHGLRIELMNPPAEGSTLNEAMTTGRAQFTHLLSHPILAAVQGLGLKYLASYQDEGFEVIAAGNPLAQGPRGQEGLVRHADDEQELLLRLRARRRRCAQDHSGRLWRRDPPEGHGHQHG